MIKKSSPQSWLSSELTPFKRLSTLSTPTNGATEWQSSPNLEVMLENSNTRSRPVKSVSTSQFQFHSQCLVSPETSNPCGEPPTSMERVLFNSTLNGRPSPPDGRKRARKLTP